MKRILTQHLLVLLCLSIFHSPIEANELDLPDLNTIDEKAELAPVALTSEEKAWIRQHPVIRMAPDPDFPPLEFFDKQGNYRGLVADYMRLIEKRLGVRFEAVRSNNWSEALDAVRTGKADFMGANVADEEFKKEFLFTRPYFSFPNVIINHSNIEAAVGLEALAGKQVLGVKDWPETRLLKSKYPEIQVVEVSSTEEGLGKLAFGEYDYMLTYLPTASYIIETHALQGLRIAAFLPDLMEDAIMVRKELPILRGILQKALNGITQEEKRALQKRWISLESSTFQFTSGKKAWLAEHKPIRIGVMDAWPPFNFLDKDGVPRGIGADYIKALNRRLDGALEIVPGDWNTIYEDVKEKRLDALMDITPTFGREANFNFTQPYLDVPHVIVAKNDVPLISNEDDLIGKTLALERGFGNVKYFRENYPQVKIKEYRDTPHALDAVARGEADAYAGNRSVALYVIEKEVIINLRIHGRLKKPGSILSIGTRKDWPILRDILQKVLDDISREERRTIVSQWVAPEKEEPAVPVITLTYEEKAWLKAHPVLKLGYDIDWPPIEKWTKDEGLVGLSADFFSIIAQRLGITIEPATPMDWVSMLGLAKKGELDLMSAVVQTPQRDEFLDFTQPYLAFPMVIVTREEVTYIGEMNELNGKKVGVVAGYASQDRLTNNHPKIKIMPAQDVRKGLLDVVQGNTFAFVGSLATISRIIAREGLSEIKISGETPYKYDLSIGIRKGESLLGSIMQKALDSISEEERGNIYNHWFSITYEHKFNYSLLWKVLAVTLVVFAIFLYWNRRLSHLNHQLVVARDREAAARREAQQAGKSLKAAKERAETADRVKSIFLATMSHELRTPLNSIIGFTGIILQGLPGPLTEEQKKQMHMVQDSARHLLSLINDVLDISKIEAGQLDVVSETFDMVESLKKVMHVVVPLAEGKGLKLITKVAPEVGLVTSDKRRVEQILINLVNNAVKFTEEGEVSVECQAINGNWIEMEVRDTGIGIKAEDVDKLFEPFQQVDIGIARKHEGTGLGLSICKRLTEKLRGEISLTSEWGKGSTFVVKLPILKEEV